MKFSINQSELQNAITIVSRGASTRSTLPILSGILLEAKGDSLTLQTTDLELSMKFKVNALVEEEGRTVVPCKLFESIVKNLPDAAVRIEGREGSISLTCDTSSFSIKTLEAADFPGFPVVDTSQEISIPFPCFSSMVKRVARVVSKDESRAVLTGVLLTGEEGTLRMVATDSYRLALTEAPVATPDGGFRAVIAGVFLQSVASLPRTEENITFALADNQIVVKYLDTVLINRRIEGNYPNYKQLLPSSCSTRVTVSKDRLTSAVRRIAVVGQTSAPIRFDVDAASQTLLLSGATQDVGAAQEVIACEVEGDDAKISFNCSYVSEGLSAVETEKVFLDIQGSMKPGVLRADRGENYLYLIMPVRMA